MSEETYTITRDELFLLAQVAGFVEGSSWHMDDEEVKAYAIDYAEKIRVIVHRAIKEMNGNT